MHYAAKLLGYSIPDYLPDIRIDASPEALGMIEWHENTPITITLKHWRDSNFDRSILLHELTHFLQLTNDIAMTGNVFDGIDETEVEAIRCQVLWLRSMGEDPAALISERTILALTGDQAFASLDWLEAA